MPFDKFEDIDKIDDDRRNKRHEVDSNNQH